MDDKVGKIVFVAMPSGGTTEIDSRITGKLIDAVYREMALLHEEYPDCTFVAPMVQDYLLLKHLSVEPVWDVWGDRCKRLLSRCDEMWVLAFDGWTSSVGVAGEMKHAQENNIEVKIIQPRSVL